MANAAAGAAAVSAPTTGGSGAQNPFQIATNLYAEQNVQAQFNGTVPSSASQQGGSINAGQYLRGVRVIVRTTTTGVTAAGAVTTFDQPYSVIQNADLVNVDGSEILYNMNAFAHTRVTKYGRPWLQDPDGAYDTSILSTVANTMNAASFTLFLQPEIRFTAGVLANTDTRSQYRLDYTLAPATGSTSPWAQTSFATTPVISVLPYMDAWAQPDGNDLQGTPNQPVPPGVNLQNKRRHQIFTMNASGSDNIFLSTLTGNAIRLLIGITRNTSGQRINGLSTANGPFYWQLDNRSLGKLSPDLIRQWAADFYDCLNITGFGSSNSVGANNVTTPTTFSPSGSGVVDVSGLPAGYTGPGSADTGVYVFPRWIEPGELVGQGWLYTANSTKLQYESVSTGSNPGTLELISDEVYPVGPVDPTLIDI